MTLGKLHALRLLPHLTWDNIYVSHKAVRIKQNSTFRGLPSIHWGLNMLGVISALIMWWCQGIGLSDMYGGESV